jgi:YidC/Oxa1 family membrane protein insertase
MPNPFDLIYQAILQSLLFLYSILGQNIGLAIIALTILVRTLTLPLTLSATKQQKKMLDIKPHLDQIKKNHKDDKLKQQEEQLKLMREHNINPAAGCLPLIVQVILLISLYHVFMNYLGPDAQINGQKVFTQFAYLDLAKPDPFYILPILAGITQFVLSAMMTPASSVAVRKNDSEKEVHEKEDFAQAMQQVQGQMLYLAPVMTILFSLTFPSGLALYWVVSNFYSIIQQHYTIGWQHYNSHMQGIRDIIRNKKEK